MIDLKIWRNSLSPDFKHLKNYAYFLIEYMKNNSRKSKPFIYF